MYYDLRKSYWRQFGILLGLASGCLLIASMAALMVAVVFWHIPLQKVPEAITSGGDVNLGRMVQGLSALLGMGLPALVFSRILSRRPLQQLQFSSRANVTQLLLIIGLLFFSLYVSGALAELNERIPLSQHLTTRFKQLEEEYNKEIMTLGKMLNLADYLYTLVIIAFIPALVEEMLFRGCLQQIMVGWCRNAFIGILVTSIIFSAIHISWYGFFPRAFLGMLLGYIYYYGKNIWLNILAHFLNNALVVTQMFLLSKKGKLTADALNDSYPMYWGLLGIVFIGALFYYFRKESLRLRALHPEPAEPENNDMPGWMQ